ncbi:unnamed protein product [Protopolystoma xenopodis]|uniref:Uncharacterized protein n=1 Tax=Protopolystoma xenopodis TaxID=117903 RepID=A0A448X204_9PLAT|nr:unnamed protein product [Protopolystoma xenopodis]
MTHHSRSHDCESTLSSLLLLHVYPLLFDDQQPRVANTGPVGRCYYSLVLDVGDPKGLHELALPTAEIVIDKHRKSFFNFVVMVNKTIFICKEVPTAQNS